MAVTSTGITSACEWTCVCHGAGGKSTVNYYRNAAQSRSGTIFETLFYLQVASPPNVMDLDQGRRIGKRADFQIF